MNNNQRFDEHMKHQFSDYAADVHPRIWENIVAKKERKKPAGFWFNIFNTRNGLLLLALMIASGTAAWLLLKPSVPVTQQNNISALATNNTYSAKTDQQITTAQQNSTTQQVSTSTNTSAQSNTELSKTGNSKLVSSEKDGATASTSSMLNAKFKLKIKAATPLSDEELKTKTNTENNKATNNTVDVAKTEDGTDLLDNNSLNYGGSLMGRLMYGIKKIEAEKASNLDFKKHQQPFTFLPDCPAFEKNAAGNKKYFEFYAGPDLALRSMSDTGNSAYLQKRKESQKVSAAFSAGIRYTKVFNNSMSIRAGINYSQINEKFTYVKGNLVQITYIIDANGDTTGTYITTGTRYKTTHNKYRSFDIPLLVGYELGNGRLHANINVGPVINVYSWQKGEVLDTALQPVSITTGKGNSTYQFKTNAGFGLMGAVSVYYKLNDKLHLMAEPYFRYNLSPLNKDNLTLKQKYNTVGLKLGLRVDLK